MTTKSTMRRLVPILVASALAVVGIVLGLLAGSAQIPPNDPTVSQSKWPGVCPRGDDVTSVLTTTISTDRNLVVSSDMKITMSGVTPYHAPWSTMLGRPAGLQNFASCFVLTDAEVTNLSWADGKFDIDMHLKWNDINGYDNDLIDVRLGRDHSTALIDLCRPPEDPTREIGENAICRLNTNNVIVLDVKRPLENVATYPFPSSEESQDGGLKTTWHFEGPPPPLKTELSVPFNAMISSWLLWEGQAYYPAFANYAVDLNLLYLTDMWDVALCLSVAAVILILLRNSSIGARTVNGWRLLLAILALLMLCVEVDQVGKINEVFPSNYYQYYWTFASSVVIIPVWALLSATFANRRQIIAIVVSALVALAPLFVLARGLPEHLRQHGAAVWLVIFCVAFSVFVMVCGKALWNPVRRAFGGNGSGPQSRSERMFDRVAFPFVVVTFTFALGFPIGRILNRGGGQWPIIQTSAADLPWYFGYSLTPVIRWIVILLLVSVLSERLMRASVHFVSRRLSALVALLLTLCAPWNSQISFTEMVSLPVWLLQFVVLWIAIHRITRRVPLLPASRRSDAGMALLLQKAGVPQENTAAIHGSDDDDPAPGEQGSNPDSRAGRLTSGLLAVRHRTGVRDPGAMLLILGSQAGRLANARLATHIASFMAIVPVGYMVWTTVAELSDKLRTFSGVFLVVLFALLEFARWVISGFVFGFLYAELPGRIGAVKALNFALIWVVSCIGPLLIAHAVGHDLSTSTIYRSAQFGLFMIVLAVVYDFRTVRAAKGGFQDLQHIYNLRGYGDIAAAVAPAILLGITLFKEIQAGSGFEIAASLVDGVTGILRGPL